MTTRRAALLVLCLTLAGHALRAQDAAPRSGLVPVLTAGDGTQVFVDAASVVRSGDSTFVASTVLKFAPAVVEQKRVDTEVDNDEIDCGGERVRGMGGAVYRDAALVQHSDGTGELQPVSGDWAPVLRATCGVLLGNWGNAPVEYELRAVDEAPQLRNRDVIGRALSQLLPGPMRSVSEQTPATTQLRARILETGEVDSTSVRVLWTERADVAAAAAQVILKMRFRPARKSGRPVPVWITLPVTFYGGCRGRAC